MTCKFEHLDGDWIIDRGNSVLVRSERLELNFGRAERPISLIYFPAMGEYAFFRDWTEQERQNRLKLGLSVHDRLFQSPLSGETPYQLIGLGNVTVEESWSTNRLILNVVQCRLAPEWPECLPGCSLDKAGYAIEAVLGWYRIVEVEAKDRPAGFSLVLNS